MLDVRCWMLDVRCLMFIFGRRTGGKRDYKRGEMRYSKSMRSTTSNTADVSSLCVLNLEIDACEEGTRCSRAVYIARIALHALVDIRLEMV